MFKALSESMQEANGQTSSTRLTMYTTCVVILATYLYHNIMSGLNDGGFVDFPFNSVLILGIVLGAKVTQRFKEPAKDKITK